MAALRAADDGAGVPGEGLAVVWEEAAQRERALASLVADGLAEQVPGGYRLPRA